MEHKIDIQQNKINKDMKDDDNNLKSKIFDLIEKDKIKPTSKLYFSLKDKTLWSLLVLSILIGSIAFSVVIFNFTNSEAYFYQATNDSFTDFILEMTPYIWIFLFTAFVFVGYENFRYTKKGYKYSFFIILAVSLVLNIIGGMILHYIGVSKIIDEDFPSGYMISSSDFSRKIIWNQPNRGILSGEVVSVQASGTSFVLRDFDNNLWMIDSYYVPDVSLYLISTSSQVRVIGIIDGLLASSSPLKSLSDQSSRQSVSPKAGSSTNSLVKSPYSSLTFASSSMLSSSTPVFIVEACYILPWGPNEYTAKLSDVRDYIINANDHERNISIERNTNCKAVRSYNIIKEMVESN